MFANPGFLLLGLGLIPYILWYTLWRSHREPTLRVPTTAAFRHLPATRKAWLVHIPFVLRLCTFSLLIIILARPQSSSSWRNSEVYGIDIMLAMDCSTSMLSQDLEPDRIQAAKKVAMKFINQQENDNIGLTVFAGEAYTQCPLTTDHQSLLSLFASVDCSMAATGLIDDGTAIGMGLTNAISRLKESKAQSKVIILLTDGSNNRGDISPVTAAEIAKTSHIRVYTIGVGTNGTARYPYPLPGGGVHYVNLPVEIDEATLKTIASKTGGKYYRATNNAELNQIYDDIGKLEKTKISVKEYSRRYDNFQIFGLLALVSLLLEMVVRTLVLRRIP